MSKMQITLIRSQIGCTERQRNTLKALGLRKVNSSVVVDDQPQILGMVNKVKHLISIEEIK